MSALAADLTREIVRVAMIRERVKVRAEAIAAPSRTEAEAIHYRNLPYFVTNVVRRPPAPATFGGLPVTPEGRAVLDAEAAQLTTAIELAIDAIDDGDVAAMTAGLVDLRRITQ